MSGRLPRVELRLRRGPLLANLTGGVVTAAIGFWLSGLAGWLLVVTGLVFATHAAYQLVRRPPRLTLTESGVSWFRRRLGWDEIASLREVESRRRLVRVRFLGIDTVGHVRRSRLTAGHFGVDFAVNLWGLDQSVEEIFALVETYSGLVVRRLG